MKSFICGFSGSGKSTILKSIQTDILKVDLDSYIELSERKSICDIISLNSLEYFRDLEYKYLREIIDSNSSFLCALGGGTLDNKHSRDLVNDYKCFYLFDTFDNCWERIKDDKSRPLVNLGRDKMQLLFNERELIFDAYPKYSFKQLKKYLIEGLASLSKE